MLDTDTELINMNIGELWKLFNDTLAKEDENGRKLMETYRNEYHYIKNGIKLRVLIQYLTKQWYEEYPTSKKVSIKGHGKFSLELFLWEKEEREHMMREIISRHLENETLTIPRG